MKKLLFLFLTLAGSLAAFSFDWPQKEIASNSFHSYFGQLRGGTLGNSIVFKESSFKTDSDKINTFERIKKLSSETEINII